MPPFPELKDITPPNPPPFSSPEEVQSIVWQTFGGVTVLILLVALWLWWRWRVRRANPPPLPIPALDHLRASLTALQPQAASLAPAALGQQIGDAIRTYLQREHGLMARYRTTEELFGLTRAPRRPDAPPPLPFLQPFADVFARCDALKFAGADAKAAQRTSLLERALAATDEVRASLAARPAAASPPTPPPSTSPPPSPTDQSPSPEPAATTPPPLPAPAPAPPPLHTPAPPPIHAPRTPTIPATPPLAACPRSDSFTHPQTAAFARGADVIPA